MSRELSRSMRVALAGDALVAAGTLAELASNVAEPPTYAERERIEAAAVRTAEAAARIAGGSYRPTYNGWPNRETWTVHLWLTNDQALDTDARLLVADAIQSSTSPDLGTEHTWTAEDHRRFAIYDASVALAEWVAELPEAAAATERATFVSDLITYTLAVVDWTAIAEALAE